MSFPFGSFHLLLPLMIIVLYDDGDDDYRDAVTEEWKRDFLR
jgi:hypothetical protein